MLEYDPRCRIDLVRKMRGSLSCVARELLPDGGQELGASEMQTWSAATDVSFHDFARRRKVVHGLRSTWTREPLRYPNLPPLATETAVQTGCDVELTVPLLAQYSARNGSVVRLALC